MLNCFDSYQQIKIGNCTSCPTVVLSGIPQGFVLGPLLFSVFINDMGLNVTTNYCLFADDLNICRVMPSKSPSVPSYFLNGGVIFIKAVVKDLGLLLNNKFSFILHHDYIISRANKSLGWIIIYCADFIDIHTLKVLYISLVRSILEYWSVVWSPYYKVHIDRIESE